MELSSLAGNASLKEQLSQCEEGRGLSHAYILSGPTGSGRHTLARLLAGAMVCTAAPGKRPCGTCGQCKKVFAALHPDVNVIGGGGKPIAVDQVRALRSDAQIRPNEGTRKVYLLEETDRMTTAAQNAMLKLLEEGPQYASFLLLAENPGGLLQTVRSRCEELVLAPVSLSQCRVWLKTRYPDQNPRAVEQAALDCQGILGRAVERLENGGEGEAARWELAQRLAQVIETGSELELFETAMALNQQGKDGLPRLLDALEEELTYRLAANQNRRLFQGVELVRQLRSAASLNVNPGQLAGWLCAGMFL